ncbi:C1-like [Macleaya cordata]|uniref:C1-like n=1 Tax=Macleaya cordata TaxID=56857 RepID=A0A200PS25_MACCD|nr:C1-like [Macleaya cordata]
MAGTNSHELMKNKSFKKSKTFISKSGASPLMESVPTSPHHSIIQGGEEKIHFSHPQHPLVKINLPYIFTCMGCKEYGAGKRFSCLKCDFDLHEFCALAPPSIQKHPLHSQHQLVFHTKAGGFLRTKCDICGKATKGYAFRCSTCSFEMHPCCAKLDTKMDFRKLHPHNLNLLPATTLTSSESGTACSECKRKRPGRVYGCAVCDHYHLHAVCAKNMINGLHANGIISTPEKPSVLSTAARIASNMVLEFFGGILEGIGEGVGGAIVDNMAKGKTPNLNNNNNTTRRTK